MVRTESGFTLIELMVSLAISAILTSLAVANFDEFKERAYDAERHYWIHVLYTAAVGADVDEIHRQLFNSRADTERIGFYKPGYGTWGNSNYAPPGGTAGNLTFSINDIIPGMPARVDGFVLGAFFWFNSHNQGFAYSATLHVHDCRVGKKTLRSIIRGAGFIANDSYEDMFFPNAMYPVIDTTGIGQCAL